MMLGLLDGLKIAGGAALGGAVVLGWMSLVTVPAAERAGHDAGVAQCETEVAKERAVERVRQQNSNQAALEEAQIRERELADRNDTLNEQVLDLTHAITSDDSYTRLCLDADRVRDLNAIR